MTDIKNLESKLAIDEHALDVALRDHPDTFYRVAMELALAVSLRDEAKQDLEEVEAEVDMELRKDAATIGAKTTEKEIESNKKVDKNVRAATDRFMEARYNAAKWTALKDAFEQKSYALSKLVDLYLGNYYSSHDSVKPANGSTLRDVKAQHVKTEMSEQRRKARVHVE